MDLESGLEAAKRIKMAPPDIQEKFPHLKNCSGQKVPNPVYTDCCVMSRLYQIDIFCVRY